MLMLKASPPGPLDEYEERIRLLDAEFPQFWGVIARADDVMRSEQWERIRRDIEEEFHARQYRFSFDPSAPWAAVIRDSARGRGWWREHVRDPCVKALAEGVRPQPMAEDAFGMGSDSHLGEAVAEDQGRSAD